jgi:hypothetical protein
MATESEESPPPAPDPRPRFYSVITPEGKKIEVERLTDDDDEIDWAEIIRTTQDDFEAGRYCFNSADYATHEEAMTAMNALIHSIALEVERKIAAEREHASNPLDATG